MNESEYAIAFNFQSPAGSGQPLQQETYYRVLLSSDLAHFAPMFLLISITF